MSIIIFILVIYAVIGGIIWNGTMEYANKREKKMLRYVTFEIICGPIAWIIVWSEYIKTIGFKGISDYLFKPDKEDS